MDASGILRHRVEQIILQPWSAGEQPDSGSFAQCQIEQNLLVLDLQPGAEVPDIRREQPHTLSGHGQADIGARMYFSGQLTDGLTDLSAEGDTTHALHGPGHLLSGTGRQHGLQLLGQACAVIVELLAHH